MMTRFSSGQINIASNARKLDVDNRISIRFYFRIADNILKQADIFREEGNIIDLYVMLLRFSSLVSETIPCHRDYRSSPQNSKIYLREKLLNSLAELEELKPAVQQKLEELNKRHYCQVNNFSQHNSLGSSLELLPVKRLTPSNYGSAKMAPLVAQSFVHQGPRVQQASRGKPVDEQFHRLSLSIPRPKEETLTRHSILGPNGLGGQWQPPSSNKGVQYPSNIDLTPVEIPRGNGLEQPVTFGAVAKSDDRNSEQERPALEWTVPQNNHNKVSGDEETLSLISFETVESPVPAEIIRLPSPPPVLAEVQDLLTTSAPTAECGLEKSSHDVLGSNEAPLQLHISTALMDSFMKLAKSNTDKNLETCGVLAGSLKNRKFYVTALIIPKQESTSDSCQTTNEEEIFEVQDKQSLFPLGWIHTHPTQSCFMSSIDLHTHYSYQIMLPEAIAIVMAPRDSSRTHGIFRLTTPGGMNVIRHCPRRGFHPHEPTADGSPIYRQCSDVYINSNLKFDIIDLR